MEINNSNLQISKISNHICNSVKILNEKFVPIRDSVFKLKELKKQYKVMPMTRSNSGYQQHLKKTDDSLEILKRKVCESMKLKKKKFNCYKIQKDIKDMLFFPESNVITKQYPLLVKDDSSSTEQNLEVNGTFNNYGNGGKSTLFNNFRPKPDKYFINSKYVFKDKNVKDSQLNIDLVEKDKKCFNHVHGQILTKTENPPSYEAHFSQSPLCNIKEISDFTAPPIISSSKSSNCVITGTRYFPPPYFSSSVIKKNCFSVNSKEDDSSSFNYLDYHNAYSSKKTFDEKRSDENIGLCHENESKSHSVKGIFHEESDYYLNNCNEKPKDYSNYSGNSISIHKKKEPDTSQSREYIRLFTDSALTVMNQSFIENEIYQMRQKHAMNILNCNLDNLDIGKQALKDNFWIVEDEPLIVNSIKIPHKVDRISQFTKNSKSQSKEYVCHICGKILTGYSSFTSHLNRHLQRKCYQCHYCIRKFSHICSLKYHLRTHTGENPYSCQICSKSFKSLSNLNKHLIVHSHQFLFKCSICTKSFKTKYSQQIHIKRHLSPPHACKICHCVFESKKSLITHIQRKHNDQKQFTCQECGKCYQYQCLLNQHSKVHSNELNYKCHLCNVSFVWRSGLASHLKTHSFKLQCEICPSKFTSLKKLDKHRHQHSDPSPHKCIKCKREFKYAYLLKKHLNKHNDDLVCSTCNLGFITKTKLKMHLKLNCGLLSFKS